MGGIEMAIGRRTRRTLTGILCALWLFTAGGGWSNVAESLGKTLKPESRWPGTSAAAQLRAEIVLTDGMLGMPTQLVVDGDELLFIDRFGQEPVVGLDRHTGKIEWTFGEKGEGPGEFMTPISLLPFGTRIAVLDAALNRVTWLVPSSGVDGLAFLNSTRLRVASAATGLSMTPDGRFLVAGSFESRKLAYVNLDGRFLEHAGAPLTVARLPPKQHSELFQGSLRPGLMGQRHVATGRFSSRIDIVDIREDEPDVYWGPEEFQPHAGRYETRFGYLDSAPMSDGFLALYSGRTRDEYPGRANYAEFVHEFTWDGELRAVHQLDADVITIAWSEPDRKLYAVRHDPEPAILEYSLPN
jgi:hypothetical protein